MNDVASSLASDTIAGSQERVSTVTITQALTDLKQAGAQRFDPVRFQFIESMARRSVELRAPVSTIVEQKTLKAVAEFQADFSQEQEKSAVLMASIADQFPDCVEQGQRLFETGDFTSLKQLLVSLQKENQSLEGGQAMTALAALATQINQSGFAANNKFRESNFSELLRQQENDTLRSSYATNKPASSRGEETKQVDLFNNDLVGDYVAELDSVRLFRESLVKLNSDQLVTRVISEGPESPGPLNPQGLVIKSLATMRELSPDYLNRFVSYIDTLLWLEQAGAKPKSAKRKKKSVKTKKSA